MSATRLPFIATALLINLFGTPAVSEDTSKQYMQIAEIEVHPARLDEYKAAVAEQTEAAVRLEPGVLLLYSLTNKEEPTRITVFEIYRDQSSYQAHLQAPHFLKYKATVEPMVKSLKLIPVQSIMLKSKLEV
jgi:quinol monooxygenase YgiN